MSDDKKLTLGTRGKLGVGKSVETGQVRQSFSHGRTKAVVVERKKKRVMTPGGAAPKRPEAEAAKAPSQPAFKPKRPTEDSDGSVSPDQERRLKILEEARKTKAAEEAEREAAEKARADAAALAAKEAAANAQEETQRQAEADAAAKAKLEQSAKQEAVDKARSTAAQEAEKAQQARVDAKAKAAEEARKVADAEAKAAQLQKAAETGGRTTGGDDAARGKQKRQKENKKAPPAKAARPRGGDRWESRGRLTISKALSDADGDRQRSVAAYRRAQAKKHNISADTGAQQRQSREVTIPEAITVQDLANRMAEKSTEVIKTLMKLGVMATINETLDQDTAELVVTEFGHSFKRVSDADVEIGLVTGDKDDEDKAPRAPVVTVMGHVDHGKTSLLDALRKANVVSGEAGGITQHIGAYQVAINKKKITFLDTPGHAAFTEMRSRGAKVTDIVVLVVAADDGIMPQTIEAINHAKAAEVPLIVAINKMDREGANPDRIRQDLLQHEVIVEAMSGDVQDVEISALKGTGLDELKEAILLQSELLELEANAARPAEGVVVEAKLDKGRGSVATVLIQRGSLKVGATFVAGAEWGKVRALINDQGQQIKEAGPSQPVEVLGLNGTPGAGDDFAVVDHEARAREVTEYRQSQRAKKRQAAAAAPKTLEGMFTKLKESKDTMTFGVVLKADVHGSVEAITSALEKAGNDEIECRVLHGAVGGITEADITLAKASGALVMGFNVRPNKQAREAAEAEGVTIKYYSIIYELIDDVKAAMAGELGPEFSETVVGGAEIKDVFSAGKAGMAAGCMVTEGEIRNDLKARILRDDVIIYNGQIDNLRRFKDDVKSVQSGQECGMTFENFNDFKSGDVVQVFTVTEIERTL